MFAGTAGGAIFCRAATKAAAARLVAAVLVVDAGGTATCTGLLEALFVGVGAAETAAGLTAEDAPAVTAMGRLDVATFATGVRVEETGTDLLVPAAFVLAVPRTTVGFVPLAVAGAAVFTFETTVLVAFFAAFGATFARVALTVFGLAVFAFVLASVLLPDRDLPVRDFAWATLAEADLAVFATGLAVRLAAGAAALALTDVTRADFIGARAALAPALRLPAALVEPALLGDSFVDDSFVDEGRTDDRPVDPLPASDVFLADEPLPAGFAAAALAAVVLAGMWRHTPWLARVGNGPGGMRCRELGNAHDDARRRTIEPRSCCGTSEGSAR